MTNSTYIRTKMNDDELAIMFVSEIKYDDDYDDYDLRGPITMYGSLDGYSYDSREDAIEANRKWLSKEVKE